MTIVSASQSNPSSSVLDPIATALAPIIWGSTYIVATEMLPPDRPFIAAMLRTLPAGLLLVLFCRRLPDKSQWGRLIVLAALNIGFFQALLFVAAYRLPGGLAAVVGAIQPLMVMALVWAVDKKQPRQLTVVAAILGIVGMAVLLVSPGSSWDPIGITAALAGAACMAAGTYLTRRWQSNLPVLAFTAWQLLIGGLILLPIAWQFDPPLPALTTTHMIGFIYLSVFGALLSYWLWFRGIARLSPVGVTSLALLSPVTAVILGWALLAQSITGSALIGLLAVLLSILVVQWSQAGPKPDQRQ